MAKLYKTKKFMGIFIKKDEKELLFDLMQLSDTIESSENHKTIAVKQSSQQWKTKIARMIRITKRYQKF